MGCLDQITDRSLGYLGLFLIGAISWAADRLGSANLPVPGVPTRVVHRSPAPARAARPDPSVPTTLRAGLGLCASAETVRMATPH
jgi:hypothetical protein